MKEAGVVEPKRVKRQAIQSSSETAIILIRIDDMIYQVSLTQSQHHCTKPLLQQQLSFNYAKEIIHTNFDTQLQQHYIE